MREIKFRQLNGKSFHYWGFIDGGFISPCRLDEPSQQFTGLLDKNGVEIYEGDILDFPDCSYSDGTGEYDDEISRGVVEWDNELAMYSLTNRMTVDMENFDWSESEVIGNIYQNQELLKG